MQGPAWEKTALIWVYDEHGGWYDHVPPQPAVKPDNVPPAAESWATCRVPTTTRASGCPAASSPPARSGTTCHIKRSTTRPSSSSSRPSGSSRLSPTATPMRTQHVGLLRSPMRRTRPSRSPRSWSTPKNPFSSPDALPAGSISPPCSKPCSTQSVRSCLPDRFPRQTRSSLRSRPMRDVLMAAQTEADPSPRSGRDGLNQTGTHPQSPRCRPARGAPCLNGQTGCPRRLR